MSNTGKIPRKFCHYLWLTMNFDFLKFFGLFCFVGNVLLSSETDLNHIRDPRSVLEWSDSLLVQNSAQYLLRVTSGGKIVRNFKILDHRFQNQVRSHNLGPSNIQNLPKYLSLQIKLALAKMATLHWHVLGCLEYEISLPRRASLIQRNFQSIIFQNWKEKKIRHNIKET